MNKLMHEQLNLKNGSPVKIKWCDYDFFKYPIHYHSEYEIIYIVKSTGKRFVGNNIEHYSDGDLVLMGSYVPHMYKSDPFYYQNIGKRRVQAVILHFSNDFFRHAMEHYPEFYRIKTLLNQSQHGISFPDSKASQMIKSSLIKALDMKSLELTLECIRILSMMGETEAKIFLNEDYVDQAPVNQHDDPRIIKILSLLHQHYVENLSLQYLAEKAGMNKAAFCRFFKEKTSKSCFGYINEMRINFACKLLREGGLSITQICYETGYNNISNFNRQFKKITKFTPSEYLREFKKIK